MNAQTGNPDWDTDMLLGEGQYESNANQIGFPVGVYAQVAMAACRAWNQLSTKGDLSGSVASIRQCPDELFQDFVDRLLKTASRILGDSQMGIPFITQLAYENTNCSVLRRYSAAQRTDRLSWVYSSLCRDWAFM